MGFDKKYPPYKSRERKLKAHRNTPPTKKNQELDSLTEISAGGAVVGKYDRTAL